jgi:hypothetical protein
MATLLSAIEEIKAEMTDIKTLLNADLFEANQLADALLSSEYPMILLLPIPIVDTPGSSGVLKSTVDLQVFFLNRGSDITVDYSGSKIETEFIEPMRKYARQFMNKLNSHKIIDPETRGIEARTYTAEYSLFDAHTFGVSVRAQVPIMERATGICLP